LRLQSGNNAGQSGESVIALFRRQLQGSPGRSVRMRNHGPLQHGRITMKNFLFKDVSESGSPVI
jgi:hypothetical protein